MTLLTQKQKILVVEDNEYTVRILRHVLERAGFDVEATASGEEAVALMRVGGLPDLAVVDFHLESGMNGVDFCQEVHAFSDLPVIMLTAVHDEEIIEQCLENHCEDYVLKPFSPDVLVARIRRVLAHFETVSPEKAVTNPVDERMTVNFPEQTAYIDGKPISLTPIETKLLYVLMRQAGSPVNPQYILRRIWPQEMAFEDRLHVHVHRLRRKIDHESEVPHIMSRRGMGYVFRSN